MNEYKRGNINILFEHSDAEFSIATDFWVIRGSLIEIRINPGLGITLWFVKTQFTGPRVHHLFGWWDSKQLTVMQIECIPQWPLVTVTSVKLLIDWKLWDEQSIWTFQKFSEKSCSWKRIKLHLQHSWERMFLKWDWVVTCIGTVVQW